MPHSPHTKSQKAAAAPSCDTDAPGAALAAEGSKEAGKSTPALARHNRYVVRAADITRSIRACAKAGMVINGVSISPTGTVVLLRDQPEGFPATAINDWDSIL